MSDNNKPKVITMCGSSRFADLMAAISWEFEKHGYIVLRVNWLPIWYCYGEGWRQSSHGAEQSGVKDKMDDLHLRKIDMSDIVFCCNANNYIGESTTNELKYAESMGKPIYAMYGNGNTPEGQLLQTIAKKLELWWIDATESNKDA